MNSQNESTETVHLNQSQTSQNLVGNGNMKGKTHKTLQKSKVNNASRKRKRPYDLVSQNCIIDVIDVEEIKEKPVVDLTDDSRIEHYVDLTCSPEMKVTQCRQTVIRWPSASAGSNSSELIKNSDDIVFVPNQPKRIVSAVPQSPVNDDIITCAICMDDFNQIKEAKRQLTSTTCGHVFCKPCISSSLRSQAKCPTCRKRLTKRSLHPIFL